GLQVAAAGRLLGPRPDRTPQPARTRCRRPPLPPVLGERPVASESGRRRGPADGRGDTGPVVEAEASAPVPVAGPQAPAGGTDRVAVPRGDRHLPRSLHRWRRGAAPVVAVGREGEA